MPTPDLVLLNLNLLVALDALLAARNVRQAAVRCGVTQSAMSHTLRQLRALFGDALLVRSGNHMLATPRAESLEQPLRQALRTLSAVIDGEGPFEPATATRRFTIAASDGVVATALPPFLTLLAAEAPGVDLEVVPVNRAAAAGQLASGEVDVVIAPTPSTAAGLRSLALYQSEFAVVARADHPGIGAELDLDTYCRLSHMLVTLAGRGPGLVDEVLANRGLSRRIALRIPYFIAAPSLLVDCDLLLTAPRQVAERLAHQLPLRVFPTPFQLPRGTISIQWHERFDTDPASRWLREALRRATSGMRDV